MKFNVFMEVFEEPIKKTIRECKNPVEVMEALSKAPVNAEYRNKSS